MNRQKDILIALAFGIWKVVKGDSKPSPEKKPVSSEEVAVSDQNAPKILRGSGKKKAGKTAVNTAANAVAPADTSASVGAEASVNPSADIAAPVPSAPGPAPEELGGLQVTLTDPAGERLGLNGWLVSDDCNWRIRIFDGVVDKRIEAMSCSIYALVELGEDQDPILTRPQAMKTVAGKTVSLRFAVTLPEMKSSAEAELAAAAISHPGLGLLKQDDFAEVVQILPGSSAARQGLQVGDAVISIDGVAVRELTQDNMVALLQGDPNTPLKIAIVVEENGELLEGTLDLMRDTLAE